MGSRVHGFLGSWFLGSGFGLLAIGLCGCGATPAAPAALGSPKPPSPPPFEVGCVVGATLRCTAFLYGEGDVTAKTTWTAHETIDAASAYPTPPTSHAVVFSTNGIVTPNRAANVYIRAEYVSPVWGLKRNYTQVAYAVGPSVAPTRLAYLRASATLAGQGLGGDRSGITIEIIEGEGKGSSCVTASYGYCDIEFLHLDGPFTVRASRPGYYSQTQAGAGITFVEVDPARGTGFPSGGSLFFTLSPGS